MSKVELLLLKNDLWHMIKDDILVNANENWIKAKGQDRAIIGLVFKDDQFIHFKTTSIAKEAIRSLQDVSLKRFIK